MKNNFERLASSEGKKAENIVVGIPDPDFHKKQEARKLDEVNEKLFGVENKLKKDREDTAEKIIKIYEDLGDELTKRVPRDKQAELKKLRDHKKELDKQLEDIQRQGGIGSIKGDS